MSKLFGLPMPKGGKIAVILAFPTAIICLAVYLLCIIYEPIEVEETQLPAGGLSDSIFDAQNMNYESSSAFHNRHRFQLIPYTIDVLDGDVATVGYGNTYDSNTYKIYISESEGDISTTKKVQDELTSVLSIHADTSATRVDYLLEESGYKNGCFVKYSVCRVTTEDAVERYLVLYRLSLDVSQYDTENDIYVGCIVNQFTTSDLAAAMNIASAEIGTLKYSKELDKQ